MSLLQTHPETDFRTLFAERARAARLRMGHRAVAVAVLDRSTVRSMPRRVYSYQPGPHLKDIPRRVYAQPIGPDQMISRYAMRMFVIEQVARKHGLEVRDLTGQCRKQEIVRARQEAMWSLHHDERLKPSLPCIGRWLGGRDHTTALHGIRKHQSRINSGEVQP